MRLVKLITAIAIIAVMLMVLVVPFTATTASAAAEPTCQLQYSSQWNYVAYGNDTIYNSACGIFAFHNAVNYLTGSAPGILTIADWAYNAGYYTSTDGTNQSMYSAVQEKFGGTYGFTVKSTTASWSNSTLKDHLANGGTAVMNVPYHYIALVGYDKASGKYHIYDSANSSNRGTAANGTAWLTEAQINSYNGANGLVPVSGCWLFTRTGSAPAWYPSGTSDLGDSFYARIKNTNGSTAYFTANSDNTVSAKSLDATSLAQVWRFQKQSDGSYEMMNMQYLKNFEVKDWAKTNGTPIKIYEDTDGANQRWKFYARDDGGYNVAPNHATDMRLDRSGSGNAQIYQSSGGPAQQFYVEQVAAANVPSANLGDSFYARIKNTHTDNVTTYITATNDSNVDGKAYDANNLAQVWRFQRQSDGSYEIFNLNYLNVQCSGGTATCENKAKCDICEAEYGEKLAHNYGLDDKCAYCGELYSEVVSTEPPFTAPESTEPNPTETISTDSQDVTQNDGCGSSMSGVAIVVAIIALFGVGIKHKED